MFNQVVVIAGVARSGTSWLGEILDSSPEVAYRFQPLFSYAFKDAVNEDSSKADFDGFFQGIYQSQDAFLLQQDKREDGLYPTFSKSPTPTCLVWKEARHQYVLGNMLRVCTSLKILAIVRHPAAVINSWLRNPKEFPPGSDPRREWRFGACKNQGRPENFFGYYKWKETAHLYLDLEEQAPQAVRVIRYEDLVDNTMPLTDALFEFVGLEVTDQTREFLSTCHSVHKEGPYSVYRDKAVKNLWKEQLDPHITSEITSDLAGTRLERFIQ